MVRIVLSSVLFVAGVGSLLVGGLTSDPMFTSIGAISFLTSLAIGMSKDS